jgi:transcriptional regulator GlxA family with amidase domain
LLARQRNRGTRLEVSNRVTVADPRVRYVLALMERHRTAPLSILELARAVNLSPAHLRRLFQSELGKSPTRVFRDLRLDHARLLLQTSFLTVKQVMAASGWNDPSHFCRDFKRRHGRTPQSLRNDTDDPVVLAEARR